MSYHSNNIDAIREAIIYWFTNAATYKFAAEKYGLTLGTMLKEFVNKMIDQGAIKDNTGELVAK